MFEHQGPGRSDRQNRILAGYLAFVGGFVNSVGFVLIGSFTSHVTGNVGRFANDLAYRRYDAAAAVLPMLLAFFSGAVVASMVVESDVFGRKSNSYAIALVVEAALLSAFTIVADLTIIPHPRVQDAEAVLLCAAMGIQNSLVTRLSGAVVRTTHLTGVVTDMGIEAARWFRWWRTTTATRMGTKLSFGRNLAERPQPPKIVLLTTIAVTFILGAMAGALIVVRLEKMTMVLPSAAVLACAAYAVLGRRGSRPPEADANSPAGAPDTRR